MNKKPAALCDREEKRREEKRREEKRREEKRREEKRREEKRREEKRREGEVPVVDRRIGWSNASQGLCQDMVS
ncbi:hypothetical protein HGM15179_014544 [Zosterops borbonicus]|uniref:Uncharacterized protein n=1 Tax=Zosterops borbonicus TaxID=364589 RepID=A0A8K1G6W1_9PASS|nr:hypothetical protein HGM15179_014544 [Zosterops borbonicus]